MLVSRDRMPARADADRTASQLTYSITAVVPMVAMAVCAMVLTARIRAAFQNFLLMEKTSFFLLVYYRRNFLSRVEPLHRNRAVWVKSFYDAPNISRSFFSIAFTTMR